MPNYNNTIEAALADSTWEIDERRGVAYLNQYLHEVNLVANGTSFKELGYAERRKEARPTILNASQELVGRGRSQLSDPNTPAGSIALFKLNGVMRLQDGLSSTGMQSMTEDIRAANANPNIIGIVLEINSPGGESLAGSTLFKAMEAVTKPTAGYIYLMASAAVKATLPVDKLYAISNDVEVGSIGTKTQINKRLLDYYKNTFQDVFASQSGNKDGEFQAVLRGDFGPLTEKLSKSNEMFLELVEKWRPLEGPARNDLLAGSMVFASEAIDAGLIDGIGGLSEAIQYVTQAYQDKKKKQTLSFNQNFNNNMAKQELNFIQRLLPFLASKANVELPEDANEETILEALEAAHDYEEPVNVAEQIEEALAPIREQVTDLVSTVNTLTEQIETAQSENEALTNEVNALRLKLSGKKVNKKQSAEGEEVPNVNTYKAAQTIRTGLGSKY